MENEEAKVVEVSCTEDDILYYLVDEEEHEVGFVIAENGREVECYYEEYNPEEFKFADDAVDAEEIVEMEIADDDIVYYLVDEQDREIGFAMLEDGREVEYYYEESPDTQVEHYIPEKAADHGYLHKVVSIASHEGGKARKKTEETIQQVRSKTEHQIGKAKATALEQKDKVKTTADELDLGITREGISEATSNLNTIAREGAETAKELKEAYDDIMDNFGFLVPKKVRRRLP